MTLNVKPIANETTFSHLSVDEQTKEIISVSRQFYCYPERATGKEFNEWGPDVAVDVARGFLSWYDDEILGETIPDPYIERIEKIALTTYEEFLYNRDMVAVAVASAIIALMPPTQR